MAQTVSKKSVDKCPYLTSVHYVKQQMEVIREDYDFQFDENHELQIVHTGDTDLRKEVKSHENEVGLVNVIKNAVAHGDNPYQVFKKSEPGVMCCIDPNATVDEILEAQKDINSKMDELASQLGVSTLDLIKAMNDGTINTLIETSQKNKEKDGE